jgi:hypothetical protein
MDEIKKAEQEIATALLKLVKAQDALSHYDSVGSILVDRWTRRVRRLEKKYLAATRYWWELITFGGL